MKYQYLFEKQDLGKLSLKNRIVMAPMTRCFAKNGVLGEEAVDYYSKRAACGLIITEGTVVNHKASNGYNGAPHFYGEEALSSWKKIVDSVHKAGAKIVPQIWHVGSVRKVGTEPDPEITAYGPMQLTDDNGKITCTGMSQQDIDEVVEAFATAAKNAKEIGFDGVEIHGAHGYLIDQFLYEASNQRNDNYGGSITKRCQFAKEIVRAVRAAVGEDFPVIFRISQWKMTDYEARLAHTPEELELIVNILSEAGVDIFHCSNRRHWESEFEGSEMNLAGWIKKISGKPTITVGSVGLDKDFLETRDDAQSVSLESSLERLEKPIKDGEYDLVAVGRGLIANPNWAEIVRKGDTSKLKGFTKDMLGTLD